MTKQHLVIIGGGAAGLAAAAEAAKLGGTVTLLERADRVGKKLLQTGNGRCNLTNLGVSPDAYNHPDFVRPVLSGLDCAALRAWFAERGLLTCGDGSGRIYPVSDTASSVLDVLRLACEEQGVRTLCGFEAAKLGRDNTVTAADGRRLAGDAVIVATGGGTALLRQTGHAMIPFSPVLCPLRTDPAPIRGLSGLRVKCAAALKRDGSCVRVLRGEVLFRDYGVSGIVIFDLSRFAEAGDTLELDLLPELAEEELCKLIEARKRRFPDRDEAALLTGMFHSRINAALLRAAGSTDAAALARAVKRFALTVRGCGDPRQAQVTRGGADVTEFDPASLRSRRCAALYAAGEALDVDGACGGFNLHWAFSSGITAARAAMEGAL